MNYAATASSKTELAKPLAPRWVFKLANLLVTRLLRSPLHRQMSGILMLITYKGRKSGKEFTHPIGYFEWADGELMAFTTARWWVNMLNHQPAALFLRGQPVQAMSTPIVERSAVLDTLEEFVQRLGPETARKLPIGLPCDRMPTRKNVEQAPEGITLVHFKLILA